MDVHLVEPETSPVTKTGRINEPVKRVFRRVLPQLAALTLR